MAANEERIINLLTNMAKGDTDAMDILAGWLVMRDNKIDSVIERIDDTENRIATTLILHTNRLNEIEADCPHYRADQQGTQPQSPLFTSDGLKQMNAWVDAIRRDVRAISQRTPTTWYVLCAKRTEEILQKMSDYLRECQDHPLFTMTIQQYPLYTCDYVLLSGGACGKPATHQDPENCMLWLCDEHWALEQQQQRQPDPMSPDCPHNSSNFYTNDRRYVVAHVPSNDEVFIAQQIISDPEDQSVISLPTEGMDRIAREWLTYRRNGGDES